ncbi:alpha/beta fold hydrolase [Vibrio superstes]|uniref:AB hydrolase superfamily protein YdjP n=1 Tax=Vibrio superstes NBRC 103154 TaxID=1219062 RepID=A0A511QNW1_9VIBR|nr:alpha/beta hydrolase [Vibrio superstes]GEM79014.1 AB hydrolase superfamily protein YdjP [Vibrio superstes NBRC 103154]
MNMTTLSSKAMTTFGKGLLFGAIALSATAAQAEYVKISPELTMHYETAGHGDKVIVFTPGWLMSANAFEKQLEHFEGSDEYTAIAYSPRSQGLTTKTIEGNTYQQHGRDLAAFMEKLELDDVTLVGWSYGVAETLSYVHQFGNDNLNGLMLIDASPKIASKSYADFTWYLRDDSDGRSNWSTTTILEDKNALIDVFVPWMLEDTENKAAMKFWKDLAHQSSASAGATLNATGFYLDYTVEAQTFDAEKPMAWVVREEWKPVAEQWIEKNTPNASTAYFGKHAMFWERPEQFNEVLEDFLEEVDAK